MAARNVQASAPSSQSRSPGVASGASPVESTTGPTEMQLENSEVLSSGSVAVAVITASRSTVCPGTAAKVASPPASIVTSVDPR